MKRNSGLYVYHDDCPQGVVDKDDCAECQEGCTHDFILSTCLRLGP